MVVPTADAQRDVRSRGRKAGGKLTGPLLRSGAVVVAGFVLYAGSPPRQLWWTAPLAFAVFALTVQRRRAGAGFGYGLLFGMAFLLPLLGWLQDFLEVQFGPWPWLAVAVVEALFFGVAGAAMARVSRLPAAPLWMAMVFVAAELLRSSFPFGGFPWGRLAFTQISGPYLALASLGGTAAVTFAIALTGTGLAQLVSRLRGRGGWAVPVACALVPALAGLAVWPVVGTEAEAGTARVGVVQGNAPNLGLGLLYADDVLHDNHIRQAGELAESVEAGRLPRPDFVVLPEQVGSWRPERTDPELSAVASRLGVPLAVGGLGVDADGELRNRVVHWDPETGAGEQYIKQHLVPFAETIPLRPVARLVSPFVDRFEQDMVPGDEPGVLRVANAVLGVGICYDVAFDDVFTGAVRQGANLLVVPTNNAWYGPSEMSYQQLAMAQLRAVEHGRAVVVSSTSGVSAVVRPDGSVDHQTGLFTAEHFVSEVPLRTSETLATKLGSVPGLLLSLGGAGALVFTWWRPRRR